MKNIICIFLVFLLVANRNISAQESFDAHFSGQITIEGRAADSVTFKLIPTFIYNSLNSRTFTFACDSNGTFNAKIPMKKEIELLTIVLHGTKPVNFTNHYIESGDEIIMQFNGKTKFDVFAGEGSPKYNCIEELNYNRSAEHFFNVLLKDTLLNKDFQKFGYERQVLAKPRSEHLRSNDLKIVEKYTSEISKKAIDLIRETLDYTYKNAQMGSVRLDYFNRKEDERDERLKKYFFDNLHFWEDKKEELCIKPLSRKKIEFLFNLSRTKLSFRKNRYRISIRDMYDQLIVDYQANVRAKLITYYLLSNPKGDATEYGECLRNAIMIVDNETAIQFIQQRLTAYTPQNKLHEFYMPDTSGTIRKTEDFTGKVILIDFWFTGCTPCLLLAKKLHDEVYPIFKDNPDFLFLTINLDESKSVWQQSIASGLYTLPDAVNLWTSGKTFEHPFIKYYNINALPTLFLVDKGGCLVTANQQRDVSKIIGAIRIELKK